ncbi:DnaJ family molecular chaperone [Hoeflea prorocentri]|uniref:DnaJ family molecular chaperone n=1 Tax=Hoeflea prorocentri TaxID=1922333 RepID=A0A9X3UJH5_9HYPH|nr:DnaJ family molecular chaperone [Hoeflea prorocentri]MCY6379896.1 DnaJ family molecular chaperone [Hoeflea prorocentri]MDA5397696.1 DnaJ family molecular chaperone [Hoeflea prorocentri]
MSIFDRLSQFVSIATSGAISGVIEAVRTVFEGDLQTRRRVAFSVAMIALSAKMAKADGIVTPDEVVAFQEIFEIPDKEARNVARLYNLAKQDVAGFDSYATKMADLCHADGTDERILEDILDGLFHIAKADGVLHEKEQNFLARVAEIFDVSEASFEQITARHTYETTHDPYAVLGLTRDTPFEDIKKHYRKLVSDAHPDRLIARGVPEEFLAIANSRMAALNLAFAAIEKEQQAA